MPWVSRGQFDPFKHDGMKRCVTERADRSGRSFLMIGQEILYPLRVTILARSLTGAMAIVADVWAPFGTPAGEPA
jgi:hypothetical protein